MRTIKLVHPSRGRPEQADEAVKNWLETAKNKKRIIEILSLDKDDPKLYKYNRFADQRMAIVNENQGMVQATNRAMPHITPQDIVITLYDDFEPPLHWDEVIEKLLKNHSGHAVFVDCDNSAGIQTIQIACGQLFLKWGYILYPKYFSMYSDNDYTLKAILEGVAIDAKFGVRFAHKHPLITGSGEMDETYTRSNAKEHYENGQKIFEMRKEIKFQDLDFPIVDLQTL